MEIWLDAHISPLIATWIQSEFSISCYPVRDLQLRDAADAEIFQAAKDKGDVIILTKDNDFLDLLDRLNAPPKIIWLRLGNCSNQTMKEFLKKELPGALLLLDENELVEIGL